MKCIASPPTTYLVSAEPVTHLNVMVLLSPVTVNCSTEGMNQKIVFWDIFKEFLISQPVPTNSHENLIDLLS
jgi:hypothetical protein